MNQLSVEAKPPMFLDRIVGGLNANAGEFPFFAYTANPRTLCGATLIHGDILLSAAHCGTKAWSDGIFLGFTDMKQVQKKKDLIPVTNMTIHANYSSTTFANDIMLMKIGSFLNGPYVTLNFNASIPSVEADITAIGFGQTSETGMPSTTLQKVDLKSISGKSCSRYYGINDTVQLCNGGPPEGGKDTCGGDSGGPLFLKGTNTQVASVSYGRGCARAGVPAVNVRISAYEQWIKTNICSMSSKPPAYCAPAPTAANPVKVPAPASVPGKAPTPITVAAPAPTAATPVKAPVTVPVSVTTPIAATPVKAPVTVPVSVTTPVAPTTALAATPVKAPTPLAPTPLKAPVPITAPTATISLASIFTVPAPVKVPVSKPVSTTSVTVPNASKTRLRKNGIECGNVGASCRFSSQCCGYKSKCVNPSPLPPFRGICS